MVALLGIGFLGGLITGISPCILPVVPVIVAGGATAEGRRRPYAVLAGLVVSFSLATLVGGALLSALHLPQDFLRDLGIAMLLVLAAGLLVPVIGDLLERPFARLGRGGPATSAGGLVLGASLGLVFVPCAGPVLAAISVVAATHRFGTGSFLLTLSYAAGVAVPLLVLALVAQGTASRWSALRTHMPLARRVAGAILALSALAIAFDLTRPLQTSLPGYTSALENHLEGSAGASAQLRALTGERPNHFVTRQAATRVALPDLGTAPQFTGITAWLNTPAGRPLDLRALRGRVVLVDFWTYSCINCQRALPHVEAWYRAYRDKGLVVVGVHTPEFPFEHVVGNVREAARQLGVDYPIAVDDDDATWDAYNNQYWPAEYLIDQSGHVRHVQLGEGDYALTERDIRLLLVAGGGYTLPRATEVADRTPSEQVTPETYLGYDRLNFSAYEGSPVLERRLVSYRAATRLPLDGLSLGGMWRVGPWAATAGERAEIRLDLSADDAYLVLGGTGTVSVTLDGVGERSVTVSGLPRLYTLLSGSARHTGLLRVSVSPGVQAYDFTFG